MPGDGKKGITVKIDEELHAEVKKYLDDHNMTMSEFVTIALRNELHPKVQTKENKIMDKTRTLAFQVSEDFFQRIKAYLTRNNMTQREFVIGLIETELGRDLNERESMKKAEAEDQSIEYNESEEEHDTEMLVSGHETDEEMVMNAEEHEIEDELGEDAINEFETNEDGLEEIEAGLADSSLNEQKSNNEELQDNEYVQGDINDDFIEDIQDEIDENETMNEYEVDNEVIEESEAESEDIQYEYEEAANARGSYNEESEYENSEVYMVM